MDLILVINSGSSTIKFSLFSCQKQLIREYSGMVDQVVIDPKLTIKSCTSAEKVEQQLAKQNNKNKSYVSAIEHILQWIKSKHFKIVAAGHRIVHGGPKYSSPIRLTDAIIQDLAKLTPIMPLHQPFNLMGVEVLENKLPNIPQIACFDTAFHATCNPISQHYALPAYITDSGVRRYGFHGLSYEYIASRLPDVLGEENAKHKYIVAHLGNGATMAAIAKQKSVATSIGFTGLGGLPMGTRCDSVDPGAILYLMETYNLNPEKMRDLLYKKSGLLGVSEISSDMRDLLQSKDPKAKLAIDIFVHRVAIMTGQLAAELQGIDGFIFTAGIGENAPLIRERICKLLMWLGMDLDSAKNDTCYGEICQISLEKSRIPVWVIPTDEELMIAQHTLTNLD